MKNNLLLVNEPFWEYLSIYFSTSASQSEESWEKSNELEKLGAIGIAAGRKYKLF